MSIFVTLDDEICYVHKHLLDLNTTGISLFWVIMVDNIDEKGFEILSIARIVGMGNSTLHHVFEKIVRQSPIEYLKKNQLHQARLLIVSNSLNTSEAA